MNVPIIIAPNRAFPAANRKRTRMTADEIQAVVAALTPAEAKAEAQRLAVIRENMVDIFRASTGAVKYRAVDLLAGSAIVVVFAELDRDGRSALWRELAVRAADGVAHNG